MLSTSYDNMDTCVPMGQNVSMCSSMGGLAKLHSPPLFKHFGAIAARLLFKRSWYAKQHFCSNIWSESKTFVQTFWVQSNTFRSQQDFCSKVCGMQSNTFVQTFGVKARLLCKHFGCKATHFDRSKTFVLKFVVCKATLLFKHLE